jgi:hypothetical protein
MLISKEKKMAKQSLKVKDNPLGVNLYIVSVVESVHKGKTVLVYADEFEIDDQGLLVFKVDEEIIYVIRSGDWKTIQLFEDVEDFLKCVRFMSLQERLDEIIIKQLEKEEAEKKAIEDENTQPTEETKTE